MSQPEQPVPANRPRWTAASIALFVIGLLILLPAALCTVVVAVEDSSGPEIIGLIVAFGGVPIGAGAALIYAGLKIRPREGQVSQHMALGQNAPRWTGASIALFVLGLLIVVPSGLCTAILGGAVLIEDLPDVDFSGLFAVLLYGALPIGIGAALVYAALKLRRKA